MGSPLLWNATKVITELRNSIGDPAGADVTRWTADELDGYFNRAQLQVVLDTERAVESSFTTDVAAGTREYALPDAFHSMKQVILKRSTADRSDLKPLEYINRDQYNEWILHDETTRGEPYAYYIRRKLGDDPTTAQPPSLFLHPTPDSDDDDLIIECYRHPDTIDSTSNGTVVVDLEAPYVEAALQYAAHLVFQDDGMEAQANSRLQAYNFRIEKIKESLAEKDHSRPSRMMARGARGYMTGDPRVWGVIPGGRW